ncbi:hypothetical protein [Lysinibacillus capsici]|uniref:hypothetical protein n=1 Tax=Lysinibacillus capsici TaxID=2115968 RepID=UPI003D74C5CB
MQGKCIQAPEKSNLVEGEIYYLFPHGSSAFEVSRFPHTGSHFGTYQKSRFEIVAEDVTVTEIQTKETQLKKYLARVIKPPSHFYRVGEEYIVTDPSENGYYSVFLKSRPDCAPVGSYLTECFDIIGPFELIEEPVQKQKNETEIVIKELPQDQWQQIDLFSFL